MLRPQLLLVALVAVLAAAAMGLENENRLLEERYQYVMGGWDDLNYPA